MTGDEAVQVFATAVLLWTVVWGFAYAHRAKRYTVNDHAVGRWRAPSCVGRPWQTKHHG